MSGFENIGQKFHKKLNFSVNFKCCLGSVNIYHLIITRENNNKCYSFYFRYNSLLQIHKRAKSNSCYNKISIFPPKKKCFLHKKMVRERDFQIYFNSIACEQDWSTDLGKYLELFGLNSDFSLIFNSNLNEELTKNPFDSEKKAIDYFTEEKEKEEFKLLLHGRTFYFVKEKLGGRNVFFYSLNGMENHKFFAKKIYTKGLKELLNNSIFLKINHENIVKNYYYLQNSKSGNLIFREFCNLGNLEEYLKQKNKSGSFLEESEVLLIFLDILKGIQYILHNFKEMAQKNVIFFGELGLKNIFLHQTEEGKRIVKIGDFLRINNYDDDEEYDEKTVAMSYVPRRNFYYPPEIAEGRNITNQSNIWSLGVILYYLCYLEYPWLNKITVVQTIAEQKKLFKGKHLEFEAKKRNISPKLKHLLRKMLRFDEDERINIAELIEHDFFREELEKDMEKIKETEIKKTKDMKSKLIFEESKNPTSRNENEDIGLDFYDYLVCLEEKTPVKKIPSIIYEKGKQDSIIIKFKKIKNQIVFLDYFDEYLAGESHLENTNILRLMVQKLNIAIILKFSNEIEDTLAHNKSKENYHHFFYFSSQFLNYSIDKFRNLQEKLLNYVLLWDNDIEVNGYLEQINPQIINWSDFTKTFENLTHQIINGLHERMNLLRMSMNDLSSKEKYEYKFSKILIRNLLVFMNMNQIFGEMSDEGTNDFSLEKLREIDNSFSL